MSQGTYDFVDSAVDSLRQGGHAFALVTLHDRKPDGTRVFSLRCGCFEARDKRALLDLMPQLAAHVEENQAP